MNDGGRSVSGAGREGAFSQGKILKILLTIIEQSSIFVRAYETVRLNDNVKLKNPMNDAERQARFVLLDLRFFND